MKSKLIKRLDCIGDRNIILLCFPYAGGGASVYYKWEQAFNKEIAVCPIQLPGREDRFSEKPYTDMNTAVNDLVKEIESLMEQYKNIAFFGHSMGGSIAYEVAKKLQISQKSIKYFFVSGSSSPRIPMQTQVSSLGEYDFIKKLEIYGGIPQQLVEQKELLRVFLPLLRADFSLIEAYYEKNIEKIDCPIVSFAGKDDKTTAITTVQDWEEYSTKDYNSYIFSGEHFFIRENEREIIGIIEERLLSLKDRKDSKTFDNNKVYT